jgi:drug/metabolite transporter (DMT)-like permease
VSPLRLTFLTATALVAFAANSILCRMALGHDLIDPGRYTVVRLATGALMLALLARSWKGSWRAAFFLFLYAAPFSIAYVSLTTGTGALIAFGMVQLTMIGASIAAGRHPSAREWLGIGLALGGLYWLVRPGLAAPPVGGALMMGIAGAAWGCYSLIGRGSTDPLRDTAGNFARASVMAAGLALGAMALHLHAGLEWADSRFLPVHAEPAMSGYLLAGASGAITSALGYVVWYAALRGLTATRAALVQTSVPVLSALGGILLLGEKATWRLATAGALILAGIVLTVLPKRAT